MSRWLPKEAEQDLEQACKLHPWSLIPKMLLGQARCFLAASIPDRTAGIDKVKESFEDLKAIHRLLPEDVKVESEFALGGLTLAHLLKLSGDHQGAELEMNSLRAAMDALEEHRNHNGAVWVRTMDLLFRDANETALVEFEERRANGSPVDDDYLAVFLPSVCLRLDQLDRGQRILECADRDMFREAGAIRYFLEAAKPNAESRRQELAGQLASELEGADK